MPITLAAGVYYALDTPESKARLAKVNMILRQRVAAEKTKMDAEREKARKNHLALRDVRVYVPGMGGRVECHDGISRRCNAWETPLY